MAALATAMKDLDTTRVLLIPVAFFAISAVGAGFDSVATAYCALTAAG